MSRLSRLRRRPGSHLGRRTGARAARLAVGVVVVVVLALMVATRLFVFPITDEPGTADVVVVLDGGGPRHWHGVDLVVDGVAEEIVHMSEWSAVRRAYTVGPCRNRPARYDDTVTVTCPTPDPDTTVGEVHHLVDLADDRGWDEIVVVASTDQITRARMLLARCFDGEARFTGPDHDDPWWERMVYETAATAAALLDPGC